MVLTNDNPALPRAFSNDVELIVAFDDVYKAACRKQDYHLCRLIRDALEVFVTDKPYGIKIEDGLNLKPTLR